MKRMVFNENDRKQKIAMETMLFKGVSGERKLEIVAELNKAVRDLCIDGIKAKKPDISERELINELDKIYWSGRDERLRRDS